jgi:hypothetical protein
MTYGAGVGILRSMPAAGRLGCIAFGTKKDAPGSNLIIGNTPQ